MLFHMMSNRHTFKSAKARFYKFDHSKLSERVQELEAISLEGLHFFALHRNYDSSFCFNIQIFLGQQV